MAPAHHSSQVEVILSDEERDVLEQRAEAMALTSLQALPAEKLRKALPAVKQGILKRLLSQASHDEPAVPKPEKAAPAAEAPPLPPPLPELDTCDDEELDQLRCSLRQKPKELPPPQDGVEAFGDDPWFAPKSEVRVALSEAAEAHHGSFKILVGDPSEEIARICQRPLAGAVLRLGGASGGFGEPDVAYAYRQLSRALHPDKNPDHPDAGEAFRRLKEAQDELKSNEMQMKRPQCALLAEACRLLAAVCALTGQGVVPPQAQQRAAACLRLPEGTWAAAHASTEALLAQWRSESGGLLEVLMHDALRTAYDCAPKRYRAQFLCLLARCAQVESDGSDGCVRRVATELYYFRELCERLRMAARFLVTALVFYQATGQEVASCQDCAAESGEDASFLQATKAKGPHIEAAKGGLYIDNKNPWARSAKKRYNHHRHMHEKVVDSTDYSQDATDVYEKVKDLSLEERCPRVKIMTLDEVQDRWNEAFADFQQKNKADGTKAYKEALEDLKADFADALDNAKPVIVKGDVPRQLGWKAADHWGKDELSRFLGDTTWQRTTFNYPDWIIGLNSRTSLKDYLANHDSKENVFLFASENGCSEDHALKSLVDTMRSHFAPSPEWGYPPEACEAIIAVDGIGSSHGFHCHDPVWNTQVSGTKHWWLLDPFYGSNIVDSAGYMEWGGAPKLPNSNKTFEFPNGCAMLKEVQPPEGAIKCVVQPGEMIILPDSWMHATCGLTEYTIAAGGWLGGTAKEDDKGAAPK